MERGEFTLNRREELRQLSGEKLKAILQARRKGPEEVKISSEMVLCNISRQENITDPSRSERRCENANAFLSRFWCSSESDQFTNERTKQESVL